jgi:uncharacterized protein DUF4375
MVREAVEVEVLLVINSVVKRPERFERARIHRALDAEMLASIPDDQVELAIIEHINEKLEGHYEDEEKIVAALPEGARALYLTWELESEVYNGGFGQYYVNSAGLFAEDAVGALEFFAAGKHAEVLRKANQINAAEKARAGGVSEDFSESYAFELDELDGAFYSVEENLSVLRIAKIRSEPALFSEG